MKFSEIKPKIKNLGSYKTIAEIKRDGLRVAYNRANDSYWLIEQEFLRPVIKSPRECKSILIKPEELKHKIFMCRKDREELRGAFALRYIEWGEKREFDKRPSCSGRKRWWDVGNSHNGILAWAMIHAERHNVHFNPRYIELDHNFFEITALLKEHRSLLCALCVSTMSIMIKELFGRQYGGGSGPIKNEGVDLVKFTILDPSSIIPQVYEQLLSIFQQMAKREIETISDEIRQPDRRALDKIIFDALELTADEREAVYEAVCDLVRRRLEKARSV